MAYVINAPEVPTRPLWYLPYTERHRIQTPRLPWGRVPVMTPPGGMAPVQDYHPGYRGYGQPAEKDCTWEKPVFFIVGGLFGAFLGGIGGYLYGRYEEEKVWR